MYPCLNALFTKQGLSFHHNPYFRSKACVFCCPLLTQWKKINIAQSPEACTGLSSGFTPSVLTPPGGTSNGPGRQAAYPLPQPAFHYARL